MTCPRCGTAVERGRVLCPSCKEPLRVAVALAAAQAASEAGDEAASQPRTLQLPALKLPMAPEPAPALDAAPREGEAPAPADPAAAPPPRPPERPLRSGDEVGDRFVVRAAAGSSQLALHYEVSDTATGAPASLWSARADARGIARALALAPAITRIDHRNVARTIALLRDGERLHAITEPVDGESLRDHLARRGSAQGFPFRSAVNVVLQLASAIHAAHALAPHGALGLDAVWVQSSGRLKIVGFGLGAALSTVPDAQMRAADVRALCALLYQLLTGAAWTADAAPAGQLRPEIPVGVDSLLQRGLSGQPVSADEFYRALVSVAGAKPLTGAPPPAPPRSSPSIEGTRWMVVKGHLDYGPYGIGDLRRELAEGRITPQSFVKSVATGAGRPLGDLAELRFLLVEHEKLVAARKAKAEEERKRRLAKRRRVLRGLASVGLVVVIAAGVVVFLMWRMQTPEIVRNLPPLPQEPSTQERAPAKVSVPSVLIRRAAPESNGKKKGRRKSKSSSTLAASDAPGVSGSPESPAAEPLLPSIPSEGPPPAAELDFSKSGESRGPTISREEVKRQIQRHSGRLRPCFDQELRRNPGMRGRYVVTFSVSGSGRSYGVGVKGEQASGVLEGCVRAMIFSLRFPKFSGLPLHVEFPINISDD